MNPQTEPETHFDSAVEAIPSCALTSEGVVEQRARHERLSASTVAVARGRDTVTFTFDESLERQTLDEMLAVERECCPFFTFSFDPETRRLVVGVASANHVPALEAMADALGAAT